MPVYVRVKRLASQAPIGSFRAERFFKRTGRKICSTNFRYIGTQQFQVDSIDVNNEETGDVLPKQCTLLWNSEQTAILRQPGSEPISCEVHLKTLKRSAQPDCDPKSLLDSNDNHPPPCKLLRIMEISPDENKTHLSNNFETMTLVEDSLRPSTSPASLPFEKVKEEEAQSKPKFVFDVYREELEELESPTDIDYKLMKLGYEINGDEYVVKESNFWYDDNNAGEEEDKLYDDEDDSNSESNWRNDYPDEEDFSSSSRHSSASSDSDRSNRTPDDDEHDHWYR